VVGFITRSLAAGPITLVYLTSEFLQPESDWWVEQAAKWYCYVNFSQHV